MFARLGSITADLPLARLLRFAEQLSSRSGDVAVALQFGRDEEGRRLLSGTLDTQVQVACQRCLQDMGMGLHCTLSLLILDTEEEVQALREDQDGVVMSEDGDLDVAALIEDELILSLPMIPMHEDVGCNGVLNELKNVLKVEESAAQQRSHPFAKLAELKQDKPATAPGKPKRGKKD